MTAGSDFGGVGDAFLDFTVFFLFGEFVLHVEFGFVDEGLLFEVKVVFGLWLLLGGLFGVVVEGRKTMRKKG